MKKGMKFISLLLVAILLLGLAGCGNKTSGDSGSTGNSGSSGDSGNTGSVPTTSEPVTLKVLRYIDMSAPGTQEEEEVVWKAFQNAHPEIKLELEDSFNDPFHEKVEAYAAAGTLPDVLYVWPSGRSTTLHSQKLLKDLTPLVTKDGLTSKYTTMALDPANQAGDYVAMIPQGVTATNMMIVNNAVLTECGLTPAKTYSEMVAQVPTLKAKGYDCLLMACKDTWVMQSCLFSLIAGRFCGEGWDAKITGGNAKFTDKNFVDALNFVQKMYDDGVLNKDTLTIAYGEGPGEFANNTAAYYIDGDWRVGDFITNGTTGEALISPADQKNFSITVFPEIDLPGVAIPGRTNTAVLGTGWGINAKIDDAKLDAAWTLVKWLTGQEVLSFRLRTGGISSPSRTDIDVNSLPLEPLQIALANMGTTYDKATVVIDGAFADVVFTPLNDGLQAIGLGTQTPQQVADIVQGALDNWLATQ